MSDVSFVRQEQLLPVLRSGNLEACERVVATRLAALPESPFHCALDLKISNPPREVAEFFDGFFGGQAPGSIGAAYTEMNGFEFNPGRWFCSAFGYRNYHGHEDYDWLADWQFEGAADLAITGLESLQEAYVGDGAWSDDHSDAADIAALLVVIRFQKLIRSAVPLMRELRFPLLSAAHDYDFIDEVRP